MPSRIPALIDFLVANLGPVGEVSDPPFVVYDGPPTTAAPEKAILWVGLQDPNSASPEEAGTSNQGLADLSLTGRTEQSEIRFAAESWSGSDDIATARSQAYAILTATENYIRTEATRFGGNGQAAPGVTGISLVQDNTQQGALARFTFAVIFKSFI